MKTITILITILLGLTSCKTMEVSYTDPESDGECVVKYNSFGMSDIKDMSAKICGGELSVGSSTTDTPSGMSPQQIACIFYGQCGNSQ